MMLLKKVLRCYICKDSLQNGKKKMKLFLLLYPVFQIPRFFPLCLFSLDPDFPGVRGYLFEVGITRSLYSESRSSINIPLHKLGTCPCLWPTPRAGTVVLFVSGFFVFLLASLCLWRQLASCVDRGTQKSSRVLRGEDLKPLPTLETTMSLPT